MSYRVGRGPRYRRQDNWYNFRDYYDGYLPYYDNYNNLYWDGGYEYPYVLEIEGMSGQSSGGTIASSIVGIIIFVLVIVGIYYAVKWFRKPATTPGQEAIEKFKEGFTLAQQAVKEKVDELVKAGQTSAKDINKALEEGVNKVSQTMKK
jgi:uncharacterized membrane protein